jgi:hypothetical protein
MSQSFLPNAETKISAGLSRVTGPAELNEMVQYFTYLQAQPNSMYSIGDTTGTVPTMH